MIRQLLAAAAFGLQAVQAANTTSETVPVKWIEGSPALNLGTTFGLPWARGKYYANHSTFTGVDSGGNEVPLQTWVTAYWSDNSIKWTGHAVGGSSSVPSGYSIRATSDGTSCNSSNSTLKRRERERERERRAASSMVTESDSEIVVNTGKVSATFPKSGPVILSSLKTSSSKIVGKNGVLVLQSQTTLAEEEASGAQPGKLLFQGEIDKVTVSTDNSVRTLVTVTGKHKVQSGGSHDPWLQFTVRFYLYANSEAIRVLHTIIFDGDHNNDFITGLGIRFDVPLTDELYNRHVRFAGVQGGFLNEAVRGVTGMRRDPGAAVRTAQVAGELLPNASTWDQRVTTRLHWIPAWGDYSLNQLSPDGFTLKKRTKAGQTWVNIPAGNRSDGMAYLGGASGGGLAIGMRDFWKKYPTGLDIRNAASETGQVTLWLYSPSAPAMDLRAYHDGMGEDTYAKQLDALEITYEDWEGGYDTPYGVARSSEVFIFGFDATPPSATLQGLTQHINAPPVLFPEPAYIRDTKGMGSYWDLPDTSSAVSAGIEATLDFIVSFYRNQVEGRRWYGFWDHGDIMHSYDTDRHTWRYDVGGYAWDNSELSPDLFFWHQFLRTGRPDVYRLAEAQVRHSSDTDIYHIGNFSGLGSRHNVLHWGDSAKQIRISTTIYRRAFYYISGGDERVGEVNHGVLAAEQTFLKVDARRKVRELNVTYTPDPEALLLDIGLDWFSLAASWLHEWEQRGPLWKQAKAKLLKGLETIPKLKNGFVTGESFYNSTDGAYSAPPDDPNNQGKVLLSHLDGSFGMQEIFLQIEDHLGGQLPAGIMDAYLDYCYYYGASSAEQTARYGKSFGSLSLYQGHSKITAFAAWKKGNATLAKRAWTEFNKDGMSTKTAWALTRIDNSTVLVPVDEAAVGTNDVGLLGLSAIQNLKWIKEYA